MFFSKDQIEINRVKNMRGGNGTIEIRTICNQEMMMNKGRLFAHITVPVGGSIGFHTHSGETEVFYFIKGNGIADDNGSMVNVSVGDKVSTGGGSGHAIINNGDENLEMIALIFFD